MQAELSHHFSAPQFTVPKTEAISQKKNASPPIRRCPLRLRLRALLEALRPGAAVIEMIAMLLADTIMGRKRQGETSNPRESERNYEQSERPG